MRVGILHNPPDLSSYVGEILQSWGLALYDFVEVGQLDELDPSDKTLLICPARDADEHITAALLNYVRRGGTVVCFLPKGELANAAGLTYQGDKDGPLRLRPSLYPAAGVAGELLPVVGPAANYLCDSSAHPIAYLSHLGRYHDESIGAAQCSLDNGRFIAFAFDLPLCVLYLRQGDPARTEYIPPGDGCARPSHMAADLGPSDAAWIPFADLLARLLVDLVRRHLPAPAPLLSHLPDLAPGLLLYSGDEDGAPVTANEDEFAAVHQAGGRMNLYIIPDRTLSSRADARRYAQHHDLGPHPNLRPLDGEPVTARLARLQEHIQLFQDQFGLPARSLRNHCTAWAGYLEPVEVMEKLGVSMDGNYFSGTYMRDRMPAPYAGFGAALPMRFCTPQGRLFNVFQQHTHLSDDVIFGEADYSYKLSPQNFVPISSRILSDAATRFHTPYAVCIHPGNWVKFSQDQGRTLLHHAAQYNLPIWSFDQWLDFCQARHTWHFTQILWRESTLQCRAAGNKLSSDLRLILPLHFEALTLNDVLIDNKPTPWQPVQRYNEQIALIDPRGYGLEFALTARYLDR